MCHTLLRFPLAQTVLELAALALATVCINNEENQSRTCAEGGVEVLTGLVHVSSSPSLLVQVGLLGMCSDSLFG